MRIGFAVPKRLARLRMFVGDPDFGASLLVLGRRRQREILKRICHPPALANGNSEALPISGAISPIAAPESGEGKDSRRIFASRIERYHAFVIADGFFKTLQFE